jgi:magnesium-transporting ATPase (P-type)
MLVATSVFMALALAALGATIGIRLWTDLAISGWATTAAGLLGVLLVNLFLVLTLAVVFVLQSRDRYSFLPLRDYQHYLLETTKLHG